MNKEIIFKYLSGNLDNAGKEELLKWINQDKANETYFSKIKNNWAIANQEIADKNDPGINLNQEYIYFKHKSTKKENDKHLFVHNKIKNIWWAAAVIVLLIYGTYTSIAIYNEKQNIEYNTITTLKGEKSKLTLSDGTLIWLNSETTLIYPVNVKRKKVELSLSGEAFFDVAKNKKRQFIVKTSTIDITVTGTRFNVKSYKNDKTIETTLERGQIIITGNVGEKKIKEPLILKPNEQACLIKETRTIEISKADQPNIKYIDTTPVHKNQISGEVSEKTPKLLVQENVAPELYTSWKDGKLMFRSEPFEDLSLKMERWYDVEIYFKNEELKAKKFTGVFEKETIEQALKALSLSMHFNFTIERNKITIY